MMACFVCGSSSEEGCHPVASARGFLRGEFNEQDWRDIYFFMRFVYLPFMHLIAARARRR